MLEVVDKGGELEYLYWSAWQVAARAVVKEGEEQAVIKLINVAHHFRGRGIGSWLLDRVVSDFGDKALVTWTFGPRVEWYRRRGFYREVAEDSIVKMVRDGG